MEEDALVALDVDCIYRMIALACAAMITDRGKDHTHVMAVADMYLEYIDPFAAKDDGVKFTLDKGPKQ